MQLDTVLITLLLVVKLLIMLILAGILSWLTLRVTKLRRKCQSLEARLILLELERNLR